MTAYVGMPSMRHYCQASQQLRARWYEESFITGASELRRSQVIFFNTQQ